MKYTIVLFLSILILFSCKKDPVNSIAPSDLAGKQKLLASKKDDLRKLETEIANLQKEVEDLGPKIVTPNIPVFASLLESKTFTSYAKVQGNLASDDFVNASSETGGRILQLTVNEGDYVEQGQQIATMDVVTVQKQLDELKTAYELAQTVFERQERLWKQNIGSELQYLEAKNNKERVEKSMETIQSQLGKRTVVAPISGYVDRVVMKQGEMSSPGMPIVQILNTGRLKIVASVPEIYLESVRKGQYVDVFLPALNKEMKKRISLIGRTIDPANRTFKIEMETSNPGNVLKPNLLAEITLKDKEVKDAIVIPVDLIRQDVSGNRYVFIVDKKDTSHYARKVTIEIGDSYLSETIVTMGLEGGEMLINAGVDDLADGAKISIEEREETNDEG